MQTFRDKTLFNFGGGKSSSPVEDPPFLPPRPSIPSSVGDPRLFRTSRQSNSPTSLSNSPTRCNLGELVAHGKEKELVDRLQQEVSYIINLTVKCEKVTDLSGRVFDGPNKVTPFELAIWTLDWHMYKRMWQCVEELSKKIEFYDLAESIRRSMLEQYIQVTHVGLSYTLNGIQAKKETCYNVKPLLEAYDEYIYEHRTINLLFHTCSHKCFENLAREQKMLVQHAASELCRLDRPLRPMPGFMDKDLPRKTTFYNAVNSTKQDWWGREDSDEAINSSPTSFAVTRGDWYSGATTQVVSPHIDRGALERLFEVRAENLKEFGVRLATPLHKEFERRNSKKLTEEDLGSFLLK